MSATAAFAHLLAAGRVELVARITAGDVIGFLQPCNIDEGAIDELQLATARAACAWVPSIEGPAPTSRAV